MHAYLIVGGNKESRLKKLEEIFGQNGVENKPGRRFNLGQEEGSLKIEDIREAEAWVALKRNRPAGLAVGEAERLTLPAQHAFLKTLEEPGEYIYIVLTAADVSGLLPTIRSRCKIIRLPTTAVEIDDSEKFRKLLTGSVQQRLIGLYLVLKEVTGSAASLHRGAVKRDEGIKFVETVIPSAGRDPVVLEAAATAHRRLKNNLNPTLTLHQFMMDI